jgi:hypothetical protein
MRAAPLFAGSYLAVWTLAGVVAFALDRPHGFVAAGAVVVAAGVYELTPVLVALDVMSQFWMVVTAVLACAQRLLPAKAAAGWLRGRICDRESGRGDQPDMRFQRPAAWADELGRGVRGPV